MEELRIVKPGLLYFSANAPKNEEEEKYTRQIRNLIDKIDWPCVVKKKYEENHIADCSISVTKAIDWFFENENFGIILEDDCLPNPSFFKLCEFINEKRKLFKDVYQISGTNVQYDHSSPLTLRYTDYSLPNWGWATWRDRWKYYTTSMDNWKKHKDLIQSKVKHPEFWEKIFSENEVSKIAWDLQWNLDIWIQGGKILSPSYNTVMNIGFDSLATLTTNPNNILAKLPRKDFETDKLDDLMITESDDEDKIISFIQNLSVKKLT
jgi:hypothetical protein